MKYILLLIIKIYQFLFSFDHGIPSKVFNGIRVCIHYPSCSAYGYESIKKYGSIIGGYLAIKRILRCHPLTKSRYDPVPEIKIPKRFEFIKKI